MNRRHVQTVAAIVLCILLSNSSCNDSCSINKVTLGNFWKETTNQDIQIDPLGGYIFFYWVDADGNACHGDPGVSGQPGPIVINAFSQEAFDAAKSNSIMSEERMRQLQQFIYANNKYQVKGSHFAQFDNVIWRDRKDGKVFMDRGFHSFSKPVVVNTESAICLVPIYAATDEACGRYSGLFIPAPLTGNQQHPSIGLSKVQPANNISENELLSYCVLKLKNGKNISE